MSEVVTVQPTGLMTMLERAALNPALDVSKFEALLRMQQEVEHQQQRRAFNRAMAAAQSEMLPVVREAKNSHLGTKYAKLRTIKLRSSRFIPLMASRFGSSSGNPSQPGHIRICATVAHEDGYSEEVFLEAPLSNAGAQGGRTQTTPIQGIGSAITYLRRYLSAMIWSVVMVDEDDDDAESTRAPQTRAPRPRPEPAAAAPADPLDEPNGPKWLKNLELVLANAQDVAEVERIGGSVQVRRVMESAAPQAAKDAISHLLVMHYARFAAPAEAAEAEATS